MTGKADITVLTLTFNERVHIQRCVESAQQFASAVFVVDSCSTDGTQELARGLGAQVYEHAWENHHGRQINWALDHLPITTEWIFRLDADEWVSPELAEELKTRLSQVPSDVNGIVLRRRQYSFGKFMRYGGQYPIHAMRIWRRGHGRCEVRWMDEHIVLSAGRTLTFDHDFADDNLKPLHWWTTKQANYALREAADTLLERRSQGGAEQGGAEQRASSRPEDRSSRRKRWLKMNVYRRTPRFVRPVAYFSYRYFLALGILDGVPGLMWHVLQAFWYRFLVDSILADIERRAREQRVDELEILERVYGFKLR
jgi:glycosyltransferase involved in cell wall biosynthesis